MMILGVMLLGLPLAGVYLAGLPVIRYLEFPPRTRYIVHAPFAWPVFMAYLAFIGSITMPLVVTCIHFVRKHGAKSKVRGNFPWWGWIGVVCGAIFWTLAWSRFAWFAQLQPHTFTPLWLSFIVVINALSVKQSGRCLMLDRPGYFLMLFPASAAFWWFFEYLNRFVQNWHYVGVQYDSLRYACYATLSFSTVLPAVLSAREWLLGFAWIEKGFKSTLPIGLNKPKWVAVAILALAGFGLAGIGVWPDILFSLLWVSPVLIIMALQVLNNESHIFSNIACGDWRVVVASALAALFCGFFWELWNIFSLAKWEYTIPYVDGLHIFEMPLLGYAGYLPFGLECSVVGNLLAFPKLK